MPAGLLHRNSKDIKDDGTTSSFMSARVKALDGLRGIAILLVLVCHLLDLQPASGWPNQFSKSLWIGVDLFFVLSGFLITSILIRTRDDVHRARNFYIRRVLRIFPAYYFVVLATVVFVWQLHPNKAVVADTTGMLPAFFLFGQNMVSAISPDRPLLRELIPLWSLAVEEQFYLLWPWLVWRCRPQALPGLCLGLLVTALVCKFGMVMAGVKADAIYLLTFSRMDTLAVGAFLAAWQASGKRALPMWTKALPVLAAMGLLALFAIHHGLRMYRGALVVALATTATPFLFGGWLQASLKPGYWQRFLCNRALVFFGTYSYGLYLVHFIADAGVQKWLRPGLSLWLDGNILSAAVAAVSTVCAIGLALVLHRCVEAPALRLKSRFGGAGPIAAPSTASLVDPATAQHPNLAFHERNH